MGGDERRAELDVALRIKRFQLKAGTELSGCWRRFFSLNNITLFSNLVGGGWEPRLGIEQSDAQAETLNFPTPLPQFHLSY